MELSKDEIETLLTAIDMWRSDRYCTGDDWSDVDALEAKLVARLEELKAMPPVIE